MLDRTGILCGINESTTDLLMSLLHAFSWGSGYLGGGWCCGGSGVLVGTGNHVLDNLLHGVSVLQSVVDDTAHLVSRSRSEEYIHGRQQVVPGRDDKGPPSPYETGGKQREGLC